MNVRSQARWSRPSWRPSPPSLPRTSWWPGCNLATSQAFETNLRPLRANGFLTRDPRMVERKKYGRPGARKKFQFSKR